jgi:hypothetical protein
MVILNAGEDRRTLIWKAPWAEILPGYCRRGHMFGVMSR